MTEHLAFLAALEECVGEDVVVEYSRDKVEKLLRRDRRLVPFSGDSEDSEEEAGVVELGVRVTRVSLISGQ